MNCIPWPTLDRHALQMRHSCSCVLLRSNLAVLVFFNLMVKGNNHIKLIKWFAATKLK